MRYSAMREDSGNNLVDINNAGLDDAGIAISYITSQITVIDDTHIDDADGIPNVLG